jgi:hypothetical protein
MTRSYIDMMELMGHKAICDLWKCETAQIK